MPRSSRRRISRPKPCLSAIAAAGQLDASGTDRWPASAHACMRAAISGSVCGANGSLSMTTRLSASPGTSTPSQNEPVPSSTAFGRRAKPIDERGARRIALDEPRIRQLGEPRRGVAQRAMRREQEERAAVRDREQLERARGGGGGERVVGRRAADRAARRASPGARSRTATARAARRHRRGRGARAGS